MAVTNYKQKCEYRLGGLKPYIYTVQKNAIQIRYKAKGPEVYWQKRNEDTVVKVEGVMVKYNQEETNNSKFRFSNTLEMIVPEVKEDPFLYSLRANRQNQEYIIVEDLKGTQYLINPELFTKFTYEYTFSDSSDNSNAVVMTYITLTNYPLLVMKEPITYKLMLVNDKCNYNLGKVDALALFSHKDLRTNDDGVRAKEVYIASPDMVKKIDYLDQSFKFIEKYENKMFKTELTFSIPLEKDQFNWHYNLIEYPDNKYTAMFHTTNNNNIIVGVEIGMSAKYNIVTSEDADTPNMVNITLTQTSQYPIIYTNTIEQFKWVAEEGDTRCFGFDKYQMLTQYKSTDLGKTWSPSSPELKKKGEIIERNSEECTKYKWEDYDAFCKFRGEYFEKWDDTQETICQNGNKYIKTRKYVSTVISPNSFSPTDEYGIGALISEGDEDCRYVATRWVDDSRITCYPVNEAYNKYEKIEDRCVGTDLKEINGELVSNNGLNFYPSGIETTGNTVIENCCACGYYQTEDRYNKDVCDTEVVNDNIYEERIPQDIIITKVEGNWLRSNNEFTSNQIGDSQTTTERVYFTSNKDNLIVSFDQSSENCCDYLIVSKVDKNVVNSTSSSNNFGNAKGETSGEFEIPTPNDGGEHWIELMYRKDYSVSRGRDNVIVTFTNNKKIPKEEHTKYEMWEKFKVCDDGNTVVDELIPDSQIYYVKERNSCDCGFRTYEWRNSGEFICGSELGSTITKVEGITNVVDGRRIDAYFKTGVKITKNTKQRIKFKTLLPSGGVMIGGTIANNDNSDYRIFQYSSTLVYDIPGEGSYGKRIEIGGGTDKTFDYMFDNFSITDMTTGKVIASQSSNPFSDNVGELQFGFLPDNLGAVDGAVIYSWQIYDGVTLVRDFIPKVDGLIGMFDRVEGKFYPSEGTENFAMEKQLFPTKYEQTSKYEIWKEHKFCPSDPSIDELTGNIEYRNPIPDCDCGYVGYDYYHTGGYICGSELGEGYETTSKYEVWEEANVCTKEKTGKVEYRNPISSCDCGYREYEWRNTNEFICGSEIETTITRVEGNWLRSNNIFTSNQIIHNQTTVERVYFTSISDKLILNFDQSSENGYDYLIVSKVDTEVVNNTGSTSNFGNAKGETIGKFEIPTPQDGGEHWIELMYRKDFRDSSGRDNVIVTIEDNLIPTSKYEIWKEHALCPTDPSIDELTGKVDYRNPIPSYDCGYQSYQWRIEDESACGNALPEGVVEVNEDPEINTDKPYDK